jgi:hypothetical protein
MSDHGLIQSITSHVNLADAGESGRPVRSDDEQVVAGTGVAVGVGVPILETQAVADLHRRCDHRAVRDGRVGRRTAESRVHAGRVADSPAPLSWSDHNVHDPGVTLLQVLAYTIGAVALVAVSAAVIKRCRRSREPDRA